MLKQEFGTGELKSAVEGAAGFAIGEFRRIGGGGGAVNFMARREGDGLTFMVKCYSAAKHAECERLASVLTAMAGAKTPELLFTGGKPAEFGGHFFLCLSWSHGEFADACQLTDEQWRAMLDDYLELSGRMRRVMPAHEPYPLGDWWSEALAACRGIGGWLLKPELEKMGCRELEREHAEMCTTHGDFHRGNLLFSDGKLDRFVDFESLRKGYPAEDVACYCLAQAPEFHGSDRKRYERLLALFRQAIVHLPYPPREWRITLDLFFMMKLRRRTRGFKRIGILTALTMRKQARVDEDFRRVVDEVAASGGCA